MKFLMIMIMSLLSFNAYGKAEYKTNSPVAKMIEQYGIEGDFTVMQGKTEFKALVGTMTNGKRDGEWTYYFPQSDKIWSVEKYSNGRPNGVWILYREDGTIKTRDDLNKKRNDSFNRPSPACMGPGKGFHSEGGCISKIKNSRGRTN